MVSGWQEWYTQICGQFGYDPIQDKMAAVMLNDIIDSPMDLAALHNLINNRTILCLGAGPSLPLALPEIERCTAPVIVADSALYQLSEFDIIPDVVVTDLDGDTGRMMDLADSDTIFVVHAHGDNTIQLPMAKSFQRCVGTTQTTPFENIHNFGGFTDGDRAVFLASHFRARSIILCGMDLNGPVSAWSTQKQSDAQKSIKLYKLRMAASLLEWLAKNTASKLYTTSHRLSGFTKIEPSDIKNI